MKKKLLSIMACLCAVVAWGQEDVTSTYLQNADFASLDGWTFTSTRNNAGKNDYENYKTDGDVPVLEFYHTWGNAGAAIGTTYEFEVSQSVSLPAGDYRIAVNAFYREGGGNGTNEKAYIFAGDQKQYVVGLTSAGVGAYTGSSDLYKAANAFSKGDFLNEFDFTVETEQTLDLGIKGYMDTYQSWCILGPVKLYKYSIEAYKSEFDNVKAQAEALYSEPMNSAVLAALKAAVVDDSEFALSAEYKTAVANLKTAIANAETSIASYSKLGTALNYVETFPLTLTEESDEMGTFKAAVAEVKEAYENGTIEAAEIAEKVAAVNDALRVAAFAQTAPGSDMTPTIVNNSFENGNTDGWTTIASSDTGARTNTGGYVTNGIDGDYLFNTWWKGTPITQTITNLPNGVYRLDALVSSDGATIYLTANAIHNEGTETGGSYPSSDVFQEASLEFNVTDGTATIGAIGGANGTAGEHKDFVEDGYWWYKADNFRLTYLYGEAVADIIPETSPAEGEVTELESIDLLCGTEVFLTEDYDLWGQVMFYEKSAGAEGNVGAFLTDSNEDGDVTKLTALFDPSAVEDGNTYVLEIPAGMFGDEAWHNGKGGRYNPALKYEFTVVAPAEVDVTSEYLKNADLEGSYDVFAEPNTDRALYKPEGWDLTWAPVNENDMSVMTTDDKASDSFSAFTVNDEATRGKQTYWARYRWGVNTTMKMSQKVNLPAGMYRLTADVLAYSADRNLSARLFAGAVAQVDAVPSTDKADNWSTLECNFYVEQDGEIELGFTAIGGPANEHIFGVDNFKLYKLNVEEPSDEHPVSVTGYIVNPTFNYNVDGWTATTGAQNRGRASNKAGDITGGFFENWNNDAYSGTIEQTINNLPLGKYTLKVAAFRSGGTGNVYAFANDNETAVTTDDGAFVEVPVTVTDGTMTIGIKSVDGGANWMGIDNASLLYMGADLTELQANLAALRVAATELNESEEIMSTLSRGALAEALSETENVEATTKALQAAANTLSAAIGKANVSIANNKLFNEGVVATDVLDNWTCTTGNTFHINTWSSEGNSDGSNMTTPFIENWVANGSLLNNGVITYTLEGMEPGLEYTASALVRVLNEGGEASTGLTMYANETKSEIASGEACNKGFYGTYSVNGVVGEDGVLKFGFEIAEATFNWVAFKNVTVGVKVAPETVYDLVPTVTPADGSEVEGALEITFDFDVERVDVDEDKMYDVVLTNKDTEEQFFVSVEYPEGKVFNKWFLNPIDMSTFDHLAIPGTYVLTVPEGVFGDTDWSAGNGGHANPELTYEFTIVEPAPETVYDLTATSTPENGSEISAADGLSFVLDFDIDYVEAGDLQYELEAVNTETNDIYPIMVTYPEGKVFNQWIITAVDTQTWEALAIPGTYTIEIPAGTFGDTDWYEGNGGHANPAWTYTFTIVDKGDGIANVVADAAKVDVYTLNGVLVLKNADREALKTLKKGIYVINGKKVVLK